jgi:hypothetical protein
VVLELREPLSVSDAVLLVGSMDARPAEFVTRYRVGGQISTAGYTIDAAQRSVSATAVTQGLRTIVASAMGKIRENKHLSNSTKARWVRDHTAAVNTLDSGHPAIHKIMVHASDSVTQRLRAQKVVESAVIVPATKPQSSTVPSKRSTASKSSDATAAATTGGIPWWPYTGFINTDCCSETGNRFVYQWMAWTEARLNALKNASGDPSNVGYEPDATYYNGDGATYLEDTVSWTTNLPSPYLDTQFADPQERKVRTVGSADVSPMVLNSSNPITGTPEASYYTLIVSEDGGASTDTAGVQGTVVHREPPFCYLAACLFGGDVPTHTFVGLYDHHAPGLTSYPCDAAIEGYCDPSRDGPPVLLSIELGGQQRSFSFEGTAGALLSLGFTGSTFTQLLTVDVLKPDGTRLDSTSLNGPLGNFDLPKLPTTGTYRVRLIPGASDVGWVIVTLSTAVTGTIVVNGASTATTIARTAQDAYIDFQGTAGQQLSLALTSNTLTDYVNVDVYRPDGVRLDSLLMSTGPGDFDLPKLPTTGTYRIRLDPRLGGAGVGTGNVTLTLSTAVTGTISVGSSTTISTTRPGQDAYVDFQGTGGQLLRVGLSVNSMADRINVTVYNPNGSSLKSSVIVTSGGIDLPALPTTGTYRIRLDPQMFPSLGQGSALITLSNR